MLANYGYKDGSGEYFITIDTDKCASCGEQGCVAACPQQVLEIITDDYDERVAAVNEQHRKKIKYSCAPCKPASGWQVLPCQQACAPAAITHSW